MTWRDTYDSWKLASPDDEIEEECFHEDYETDINGHATCCQCNHSWWMTDEEIKNERERVVAYNAMMRREEWRERCEGWIIWLCFWRRWLRSSEIDDDIPF